MLGDVGSRARPARGPGRRAGRSRGPGCGRCRAGARATRPARTARRSPGSARRRRGGRGRRPGAARRRARPGRRRCGSPRSPSGTRISRSASPACVVVPRPVAHRHLAAADRGQRQERAPRWTGRARWSGRRRGPGRARPPSGSRRRRRPRRRARAAWPTVISMWGSDGTGLPSWRTSTPSSKRGAGEQQRGDELRGGRGVDDDASRPGRGPVPWTVNGSAERRRRPRRGVRSASSTSPTGRSRMCGSPSKSTGAVGQPGDGRQEAHHGAGQAAVDLRRPGQRAGRDDPRRAARLDVACRGRAAPPASATVSRDTQRAAYDAGPVGQGGQHQRAVGLRLAAGQRDDRRHRRRWRAAPARDRPGRCAVLVVTRAAYPVGSVDLRGRASLASRLAVAARWPASRRASLAARRARQATPGLPSVSTLAMQQPAEHRDVLEEVDLLVGARRPGPPPPRTGGRRPWSGRATRPARSRRAAGRGRWRAAARRRPGRRR